MLRRVVWIMALAMSVACVRMPPEATAPRVCEHCVWWPSNAWLSVQKNGELAASIEVEAFPDDIFDLRFSGDRVPTVIGIRKPYQGSIYEQYRDLAAGRGVKLSRRAFRKAMRRGQLTCHAGSYALHDGKHLHPAGRNCVNELLLSVPPPPDPEHLLASLDITIHADAEEFAGFSIPGSEKDRTGAPPSSPAEDPAAFRPDGPLRSTVYPYLPDGTFVPALSTIGPYDPMPRLDLSYIAPWPYALSILRGAIRLDSASAVSFTKAECIQNLPTSLVAEDPVRTDQVVTAFVEYSRSEAGKDLLTRYTATRHPSAIWEDPCLPEDLTPYFKKQKLYLLPDAGLAKLEDVCTIRTRK